MGVAGPHLVPREEPGHDGVRRAQGGAGIAGLGPVDEQLAHVGQHVAQRAQLPVENGQHLAVVSDDGVVDAVVAVDDAGRPLLGNAGREEGVHLVDEGDGALVEGG